MLILFFRSSIRYIFSSRRRRGIISQPEPKGIRKFPLPMKGLPYRTNLAIFLLASTYRVSDQMRAFNRPR